MHERNLARGTLEIAGEIWIAKLAPGNFTRHPASETYGVSLMEF